MNISLLSIPGLALISPNILRDERGEFLTVFCEDAFGASLGMNIKFVQTNQSSSRRKGTIRGMHYQSPPHEQGKLIQCLSGSFTDVVVDVRKNSTFFGQHQCIDLKAETAEQLWIPPGFLHGFVTRQDNTIVQYRTTGYFDPRAEGRIAWNDPLLGIDWGLGDSSPVLSDKDKNASSFEGFITPFEKD